MKWMSGAGRRRRTKRCDGMTIQPQTQRPLRRNDISCQLPHRGPHSVVGDAIERPTWKLVLCTAVVRVSQRISRDLVTKTFILHSVVASYRQLYWTAPQYSDSEM